MKPFSIIVLAACTFSGPAVSLGSVPRECGTKPNSYVPAPYTNRHVYGAPIHPAIAGHAKYSHRKHAPKKPSSR